MATWTDGIVPALLAVADTLDVLGEPGIAADLRLVAPEIDESIESTYPAWRTLGADLISGEIRMPSVRGSGRMCANIRHALDPRQSASDRAACAATARYCALRVLYDLGEPLNAAGSIVELDFRDWLAARQLTV